MTALSRDGAAGGSADEATTRGGLAVSQWATQEQTLRIARVWSWLAILVMFAAAAYANFSRFENPSGEKYIPDYYFGGQLDFSYPYLGARALLAGENPYTTTSPRFTHPIIETVVIKGVLYKQVYPPTHLLTYVPLAAIFGADSVAAGRCFFRISLIGMLLLGVITWRLVGSIRGQAISPFFIFFATATLTMDPGVQLALERGQSDILTSLICWAAVLAMVRGWVMISFFLAVWAAAIKAYPALLGVGLAVIALRPALWRRALLGTAWGLGVFVAPVARYLPEGFKGTVFRAEMNGFNWYNHSFKNLVFHVVSATAAHEGRVILATVTLLVTGLWVWRVRQRGRAPGAPGTALAYVAFATAALLAVIGSSALSVAYNLIIVLPGALMLAVCQDRIAASLRLSRLECHLVGALSVVTCFALFLVRWNEFPLGGLGLFFLLVLLAFLAVRMPMNGVTGGAR